MSPLATALVEHMAREVFDLNAGHIGEWFVPVVELGAVLRVLEQFEPEEDLRAAYNAVRDEVDGLKPRSALPRT